MDGTLSELGFGIMRMPQLNGTIEWEKSETLIVEYMRGEFCYFDTHPAYMMGKSQEIIRKRDIRGINFYLQIRCLIM